MLYKIVRLYANGGRKTLKSGLYLSEVQEHCKGPEASSSTCVTAAKRRITRLRGDWFDGYDIDRKNSK
jgi:hypothetical protein